MLRPVPNADSKSRVVNITPRPFKEWVRTRVDSSIFKYRKLDTSRVAAARAWFGFSGKARASPTFRLLTTRISGTLNRLLNSYLQSVCGQSDSDSKLLLVYGGCWSSEARGKEQSWSMQPPFWRPWRLTDHLTRRLALCLFPNTQPQPTIGKDEAAVPSPSPMRTSFWCKTASARSLLASPTHTPGCAGLCSSRALSIL